MNIVGCLSWYDESPTWLASCVAGFARVCDNIVAVDGAYSLYPKARPRSLPDQAYAIQDACEAAGAGCVLHRPRDVWWGNEVEKRQMTLDLARPLQPDWVLVFDADYLVMRCEPDIVRATLEETDHVAATYTLVDSHDLQADEAVAERARETAQMSSEWVTRTRCIYRWTDDLTYGPAHFHVRGTYDGEPTWVYGPDLSPTEHHLAAEKADLNQSLIAVHRRQERAKVRADAAKSYGALRDQAGIEAGEMTSVLA